MENLFDINQYDTKEFEIYLNHYYNEFFELDDIDVTDFEQLEKIENQSKKRPLGELDVNSIHSSKRIKLEKWMEPANLVGKLNIELNKQIWEKLSKKCNRIRILKTKLSEKETNEFNRINGLLDTYIKDLGWCTANTRFTKSNEGYLLRNKCRFRPCKSYWGMAVNVFTNEALVYCDFKCDHTI